MPCNNMSWKNYFETRFQHLETIFQHRQAIHNHNLEEKAIAQSRRLRQQFEEYFATNSQ